MDEGRMVDLLLVRLSREDEKKKVIDLLVGELGMTEEEASDKVENSPVILRENVEMEQGRILQDRMYPFVDLLPKYYKPVQEEKTEDVEKPQNAAPDPELTYGSESVDRTPEAVSEEISDDYEELEDEGYTLETEDEEELGEIIHGSDSEVVDDFEPISPISEEEDESMIITSAAEEMIAIQRCHICGRTPTNGQKLVPCTTCGELTCADCYNRKAHVCEKCASQGKSVDRPMDHMKEAEVAPQAEPSVRRSEPIRKTPEPRVKVQEKRIFGLPPVYVIIGIIVVIAVAFFMLDPLNLFGAGVSEEPVDVSLVEPDTSMVTVVPDTIPADTTAAADTATVTGPDSLGAGADSLQTTDTVESEPVLSLSLIALPDSLEIPDEIPSIRELSDTRISALEVLKDSLPYIQVPLSQLAALHSIELDAFTLVRTENGFDILLMSILHPEPAERRAALLGHLGSLLDSTTVDQMVLYYQENQYYEPNLFSFTADSFSVLSLSTSPYFLQRKQALLPETTELVTGSIFDWMTDLD